MTTSNSWGIPVRRPHPDEVGFSLYHTQYRGDRYRRSRVLPRVQPLRKQIVRALRRKPVFIHELQLEPWGPEAIWKMSLSEQAESMNIDQISRSIASARRVKGGPIDLWGGEWWYWRQIEHDDPTIWQAVSTAIHTK